MYTYVHTLQNIRVPRKDTLHLPSYYSYHGEEVEVYEGVCLERSFSNISLGEYASYYIQLHQFLVTHTVARTETPQIRVETHMLEMTEVVPVALYKFEKIIIDFFSCVYHVRVDTRLRTLVRT